MREYTVLFKLSGKTVYATTIQAISADDAIQNTEFKPYFYGYDYDSYEAFETFN